MYFPARCTLVTAQRGLGTFINGSPVTLSSGVMSLKQRLIGLDLFEAIGDEEWHNTVKPLLSIFRVPLNEPACATVLSLLHGFTAAAYTNDWKIWDAAAGLLALEEAGGRVGTAKTVHRFVGIR